MFLFGCASIYSVLPFGCLACLCAILHVSVPVLDFTLPSFSLLCFALLLPPLCFVSVALLRSGFLYFSFAPCLACALHCLAFYPLCPASLFSCFALTRCSYFDFRCTCLLPITFLCLAVLSRTLFIRCAHSLALVSQCRDLFCSILFCFGLFCW